MAKPWETCLPGCIVSIVLRKKDGLCIKRTLLALVVLKGLEGHEGGAAGEELVGELGLVAALLELVVVFLGVA